MCSPDYSSGEWTRTPYKHLDKRFSGHERALPPEPAGADAWRATTYGHGVLQTNPLGSALDQVNQVRILEGQLRVGAVAATGPLAQTSTTNGAPGFGVRGVGQAGFVITCS